MNIEDPRDAAERRGITFHTQWFARILQSPWSAVCIMGSFLLLYLSNAESLHWSSLQIKAAGQKALEHAALKWRGLSAASNHFPGTEEVLTGGTRDVVATLNLEQLRDRLRPLKVGALVFYGRRRYVKLLNMYLERNLATNGGILDEVVFAVRTNDTEDLRLLEALLARNPGVYRRSPSPSIQAPAHWQQSYTIIRSDSIYVKIDDDTVFIQVGAIEAVVKEMLQGRYLFVSANVVNHPLLSHVHAQLGALLPFHQSRRGLNPNDAYKPFVVSDNVTVLDDSPARAGRYEAGDACWSLDWQCAAIAHYSFLHHLSAGSLGAYDFNTWDLSYPEYQRWSINFFAFNSSDLTGPLLTDKTDDEAYISQTLPAFRKQHAAAVGTSALVVHFAYFAQEDNLLLNAPGLLQEYTRVAEEYTNGTLLLREEDKQVLKGKFGLVLPNNNVVPLDNPNDPFEVAQKTATLGGEFGYYQKDFVAFNGTDIRLG